MRLEKINLLLEKGLLQEKDLETSMLKNNLAINPKLLDNFTYNISKLKKHFVQESKYIIVFDSEEYDSIIAASIAGYYFQKVQAYFSFLDVKELYKKEEIDYQLIINASNKEIDEENQISFLTNGETDVKAMINEKSVKGISLSFIIFNFIKFFNNEAFKDKKNAIVEESIIFCFSLYVKELKNQPILNDEKIIYNAANIALYQVNSPGIIEFLNWCDFAHFPSYEELSFYFKSILIQIDKDKAQLIDFFLSKSLLSKKIFLNLKKIEFMDYVAQMNAESPVFELDFLDLDEQLARLVFLMKFNKNFQALSMKISNLSNFIKLDGNSIIYNRNCIIYGHNSEIKQLVDPRKSALAKITSNGEKMFIYIKKIV